MAVHDFTCRSAGDDGHDQRIEKRHRKPVAGRSIDPTARADN
jgi:hypothetical protein